MDLRGMAMTEPVALDLGTTVFAWLPPEPIQLALTATQPHRIAAIEPVERLTRGDSAVALQSGEFSTSTTGAQVRTI
jgi:hypothetical protein